MAGDSGGAVTSLVTGRVRRVSLAVQPPDLIAPVTRKYNHDLVFFFLFKQIFFLFFFNIHLLLACLEFELLIFELLNPLSGPCTERDLACHDDNVLYSRALPLGQ